MKAGEDGMDATTVEDDSLTVSKDILKALVKGVLKATKPQDIEGSPMKACYLDDLIVVFLEKDGRNTLYGTTVSVLGREFQILPDGQVALSDGDDSGNPVYVVEDDNIVAFLEDFIKLRTKLLLSFGA